jgi:hypothetical protein
VCTRLDGTELLPKLLPDPALDVPELEVISSRRGFIPAGPRGQVTRYSFPPCDLAPRAGCPRARRVEIADPRPPLISEAVPGSGGARCAPHLAGHRSGSEY